jgi:hypothetical protein
MTGDAGASPGQDRSSDGELGESLRRLVALGEVASAAVFVRPLSGQGLELAAAAGIDGPALRGLTAAVRNPGHPIARTMVERVATFDVRPTARGGPALRSHVPLVRQNGTVVGVLAVAHEDSLGTETRASLIELAEAAAGD